MTCTRCSQPIIKGEQKYHRTSNGPHHYECPKPDDEVICSLMEAKPPLPDYWQGRQSSPLRWWMLNSVDGGGMNWYPAHLTLDLLHEAEKQLTDAQCIHYERELYWAMLHTKPKPRRWFLWLASPQQRIKALAIVIRKQASAEGEHGSR